MSDKGFIYSFWNNNNLLYLGKTEGALLDRLKTHSHCPKEMYKKITNIRFIQCNNPLVLDIMEKVLIFQLNPEYNIRDRYEKKDVEELLNKYHFSFSTNWEELPSAIFQFSSKKLTPEEIKERQLAGVQKAKAQGKYKGRKPQMETRHKFVELLPSNLSGERTARSICNELGISPNSFYRWKLKYEQGRLFE